MELFLFFHIFGLSVIYIIRCVNYFLGGTFVLVAVLCTINAVNILMFVYFS